MSHHHDILPQTAATAQLVRLMVWRLNEALLANRHSALTISEHRDLFDLAKASAILDRVAMLPGMARAEERMRGDLLDLFAVFNPGDPLEQTFEDTTGNFVAQGVQVIA